MKLEENYCIKLSVIEKLIEDGYSPEEANNQVRNAEVIVYGNIVKVIYDNDVFDKFEIKDVVLEHLVSSNK